MNLEALTIIITFTSKEPLPLAFMAVIISRHWYVHKDCHRNTNFISLTNIVRTARGATEQKQVGRLKDLILIFSCGVDDHWTHVQNSISSFLERQGIHEQLLQMFLLQKLNEDIFNVRFNFLHDLLHVNDHKLTSQPKVRQWCWFQSLCPVYKVWL